MAMVHCSCDFASKQVLRRPLYAAAGLTQSKGRFSGKTAGLARKPVGTGPRSSRSAVVEVLDFKFLKNLGLKKPEFLPDFGKEKRQVMLDRFFTSYDKATLEELLSDNAQIVEQSPKSHATKDKDGYCLVTVQATGHHTGKPLRIPGSEMAKVDTSQKKFTLQEASLKVKVEDGQIQEINMMPTKGAGFTGLYEALGGRVPSAF
ncbi:hypothetical protein WJX79_010249 [Trebouxia sp. C0005]